MKFWLKIISCLSILTIFSVDGKNEIIFWQIWSHFCSFSQRKFKVVVFLKKTLFVKSDFCLIFFSLLSP